MRVPRYKNEYGDGIQMASAQVVEEKHHKKDGARQREPKHHPCDK